jgi:hypothetical protein
LASERESFNGSSNVSLGFNNEFDNDPFYKRPVLKVLSPGQ